MVLVDQGPCSGGQTCENGVCTAPTCAGGCVTPPGPICVDANSVLAFDVDGGPGVCNNGTCAYSQTVESCPYGCISGVCSPQPACSPGSVRCNGNQVETCNAAGTAWLFASTCPNTCTSGLCDAPCTPFATRCDGSTVDTCSADGSMWVAAASACAQGCISGSCLQSSLTVDGTTVYMQGTYYFSGTFDVQNGGSVIVGLPDGGPSSGELTIHAQEIDIEVSSSITGSFTSGGGTCLADPDDVTHGIRLYANTVVDDGYVGWQDGECSTDGVVIRADTINGSGTVRSSLRSLLLYGAGGLALGLDAGSATTSLMPPTDISSPTHPQGGIYNDDAPPPIYSWDKPFSTVTGYYYVYGTNPGVVPSQTDNHLYTEALALSSPAAIGTNYLDVISVDNTGTPGTVPHQFGITVVGQPPELFSPTNPNQGTYTSNTAVTVQYDGGNAGVGYYWSFDDFPDTRPGADAGTFIAPTVSPAQVYLQNVASGRHWFHMIAYDTMGYPTLGAAHYEVDIGTAPANGTIAGNVTQPDGGVITGASIVVQRGVYTVSSDTNGIYDFNDSIPAGTYEVVANASGYQSQQVTLTVSAGATTDQNFVLYPGTGCPTCTDLCSGVACPSAASCSGNDQLNPPPWSATCFAGTCEAEVAAANSSYTYCQWGCFQTSCAGGSDGDGCSASDECDTGYCEQNDVCGTSYCYSGLGSGCSLSYGCCAPYTCTQEGAYYYCE